ncbi:substrate-binding domain-containing protein [Dongshaea marina]|uniref:substrate-binding domain-containing protein n=1 Tax=Dongshaea marina TaxID=2047966 RepID=UPI001F3A6A0D|nr:substrate-binding domain-containing protein [Dongshaea marina]
MAQQFATKKTNFVGFVITNSLFNGPYFSSLVYHAALFSEQSGHQLVMVDGKRCAEDEKNAINFLLDMKCAGIIVYPHYLSEQELTEIIDSTSTPIIVLNRDLVSHPDQSIVTNHYQSAYLMMEHILEQGHRDIAFIRGATGSLTDQQRFAAYQDALSKHDLEFASQRVVSGNWTLETGYRAAKELVQRGVDFSAVVAGNDDMALGAMKAFSELGFNLPQEISIAGFDNSEIGGFFTPSLTTVSIPLKEMIHKAVLKIIGKPHEAELINICGTLVQRDSVQSHSAG